MCQFRPRLFLATLTICVLFHGEKHRKTPAYAVGVSLCLCCRPLPLGLMSCKLSSHIRGFQNAFNNAWPHSVWVSPRDKHARSSSVRRAKRDRQTASLPVPSCVCVSVCSSSWATPLAFDWQPSYNGSGSANSGTILLSPRHLRLTSSLGADIPYSLWVWIICFDTHRREVPPIPAHTHRQTPRQTHMNRCKE